MFIEYLEDRGKFAKGDVRECDDRTAMGEILSGAAVYGSGPTPASVVTENVIAAAELHADRFDTA